MSKRVWILPPIIILCLVVGAKEAPREPSFQSQVRPNILLVLTDDQDAGSISEMPNVQSQLVDKVPPTTAPSRQPPVLPFANLHTTRPVRPQPWSLGQQAPDGGFPRFQELGLEESTVATWLDRQATTHGKYLNEYGDYQDPNTHVPPGWDRWIATRAAPRAAHERGLQGQRSGQSGPHRRNRRARYGLLRP